MLYGGGESGTSRWSGKLRQERVAGLFRVGMREFGIGLQSGTKETPDAVGIEAWIGGRPPHRSSTADFWLHPASSLIYQSRGNSQIHLPNLGLMLNCHVFPWSDQYWR